MKQVLTTVLLTISIVSPNAFAEKAKLRCNNEAVKLAVLANFKKFGANTSSVGAKLVYKVADIEAYAVATSDETESSEYLAVFDTKRNSKTNKIEKDCVVKTIAYAAGPDTPSFTDANGEEDLKGIVSTIECEIDGYDKKLVCK